jgi:hypothetical protein
MNKKALASIAIAAVIISIFAIIVLAPLTTPQPPQQELDFTVGGTNDCLRFFDLTVKTIYTPFRTEANEHWRLTIEPLKIPGSGGWTDLYVYNGYWDNGTNHTCLSKDLYSILSDVPASNFRMTTNSTFSEVYGGATPQSYTVFFILPPGGEATFHIKLERVS